MLEEAAAKLDKDSPPYIRHLIWRAGEERFNQLLRLEILYSLSFSHVSVGKETFWLWKCKG